MMRDNGVALVAAPPCVTTLVWPSEAVPESVLTTLTGPGAPFELREEAVLGAPMLVFANRPKSLVELLHGAAERMGDQPYVIFPDREYTFASILQPIAAVAAALRDRYGIGPGRPRRRRRAEHRRVRARCSGRRPRSARSPSGSTAGGRARRSRTRSSSPNRRCCSATGVASNGSTASSSPTACPVVEFERDFAALEQYAPDAPFPDVAIDEDDPFVILFTSGTTGRPKGVMLSHRSNIHFLLASMLNGGVGDDDRHRERRPGRTAGRASGDHLGGADVPHRRAQLPAGHVDAHRA